MRVLLRLLRVLAVLHTPVERRMSTELPKPAMKTWWFRRGSDRANGIRESSICLCATSVYGWSLEAGVWGLVVVQTRWVSIRGRQMTGEEKGE